jgi:hypothetical protein
LNGRARNVLRRFPAHLEAAREGKRLADVTEALALDIDTLSAALARVRRARRLLDADELRDLLRIGALHGITASELAVLFTRFDIARALIADAATSDDAAEQLIALWGIVETPPRLARFSPRATFVGFAERALADHMLLDGVRRRIGAICANHARGNGTTRALMAGAANALDLDVISIAHSTDRYLHIGTVEDRLRLAHPEIVSGKPVEREFAPAQERLLIEENPFSAVKTGDVARQHGELFSVLRRGFERETLQVLVTGVENRTVGPMLVNRDEGRGVGFVGAVPSGTTLSFTEEGRVMLDSTDVTSLAFAWTGACFADGTSLRPTDFVFDGPGVDPARRALFATSTPAGAIGADFVFPHAGDSLPMPGISVGETRFAFFVQEAHFSHLEPGVPLVVDSVETSDEETSTLDAGPLAQVARVEPRPKMGFLNASVFAPGPLEARATAAVVALAWHERIAFWVNVWIPKRFLALTPDDEDGRDTLGRVALAVNRFRPAGVHVDVKFLDDRWVLGRGVTISEESPDGEIAGPGSGTELWSAPTE